jgi:hypothetical protein
LARVADARQGVVGWGVKALRTQLLIVLFGELNRSPPGVEPG